MMMIMPSSQTIGGEQLAQGNYTVEWEAGSNLLPSNRSIDAVYVGILSFNFAVVPGSRIDSGVKGANIYKFKQFWSFGLKCICVVSVITIVAARCKLLSQHK